MQVLRSGGLLQRDIAHMPNVDPAVRRRDQDTQGYPWAARNHVSMADLQVAQVGM
jgi:hypothetical protein